MVDNKDNMRIFHFLPGNTVGGISLQTLGVAETLNDQGYVNTIVTPEESGDFLGMAADRGVNTFQLPYFLPKHFDSIRSLTWNMRWVARFVPSVYRLRKQFRRHNPDVVHLNGLMMLQPAIAAWLEDIDVVWYLVSDNIYPEWLVSAVIPLVNRIEAEVVLISESNRGFYRQDGRDVSIIPGGIDTSRLDPEDVDLDAVESLASEYDVEDDDTVVVTLAKTHPMKGQIFAVEAFDQVNRDCLKYLIVGPERDPEYTDRLRQRIHHWGLEDTVYLTGFVDDKTAALALADIFLLPSLGEGTPLAIMEAMMMKTPVIATAVGGVPDMLDGGDAGTLIPPKDPAKIADSLDEYLSNPQLLEKHSSRGRELIQSRYSIENISDRYDAVYQRL